MEANPEADFVTLPKDSRPRKLKNTVQRSADTYIPISQLEIIEMSAMNRYSIIWSVELTLKKSQLKQSVLFAGSFGMNFPLSSARYRRMLPVSKILRCASYVHRTSREATVVSKNRIVIILILVPECLSSPTNAVPIDFLLLVATLKCWSRVRRFYSLVGSRKRKLGESVFPLSHLIRSCRHSSNHWSFIRQTHYCSIRILVRHGRVGRLYANKYTHKLHHPY